jgi:hypothetical protein
VIEPFSTILKRKKWLNMKKIKNSNISLSLETAATHNLFTSLDTVTSTTVTTSAAAYYLNRRPQTLRAWACLENGPIRPLRINGRLAWRVSDLLALLNGGL